MNTSPIDLLLAERGKTHGNWGEQAGVTNSLKMIIDDYQERHMFWLAAVHQEAIDMIFTKIGRIVTGDPNHADSWTDIAGYATLGLKSCVKPSMDIQESRVTTAQNERSGTKGETQPQTTEQVRERVTRPQIQTTTYYREERDREASDQGTPGYKRMGGPY